MIEKINTIKLDSIFKTEHQFFIDYKKRFSKNLLNLLDSQRYDMANDLYDALFDYRVDCYEEQLYCLDNSNNGKLNLEQIVSILSFQMAKDFVEYKKSESIKSLAKLLVLCSNFSTEIIDTVSNRLTSKFDVAPLIEKEKNIQYLLDICRLKDCIKFISYKEPKTDIQNIDIEQVGRNSIVIKTTKEHIDILKKGSSSFMVVDRIEKEYFSSSVKFFCDSQDKVVLENIKRLESQPLLSRKYPRASILQKSIVQIVSKDEQISGNLIDISEGGIGIMSSTKSNLKKGQDVSVLMSYEDRDSDLSLNFESDGILTSIIGKKHAFRYGVRLILSDKEREIISNFVEKINHRKKS